MFPHNKVIAIGPEIELSILRDETTEEDEDFNLDVVKHRIIKNEENFDPRDIDLDRDLFRRGGNRNR